MSVFFNVSTAIPDNSSNSNLSEVIKASYTEIGTREINGTTFTLMDLNFTLSFFGFSQNESGTIFFAPSWNITLLQLGGYNATGALANQVGGEFMIFFELPVAYTRFETALLQSTPMLHEINQTTITFGKLTIPVTNYNATQSVTTSVTVSDCGESTIASTNATSNSIIQMGTIPNTDVTIMTMSIFHSTATASGGITATDSGLFQISSLALAPQSNVTSYTSSSSSSNTANTTTSLTSI